MSVPCFPEEVLCWGSQQTASTFPWPQEICLSLKERWLSGPFLSISCWLELDCSWLTTVCFGSCLRCLSLPIQEDFSPVGASQVPNFRLYIPLQEPVTQFLGTESFTGFKKLWLGVRKTLLPPATIMLEVSFLFWKVNTGFSLIKKKTWPRRKEMS